MTPKYILKKVLRETYKRGFIVLKDPMVYLWKAEAESDSEGQGVFTVIRKPFSHLVCIYFLLH